VKILKINVQRMPKLISHRGLTSQQNTVRAARLVCNPPYNASSVELDVRYNSKNKLVLCHDANKKDSLSNDTFADLCSSPEPLSVVLDMKACGINEGYAMAHDVIQQLKGTHHTWQLCSFNEYCVKRLLELGTHWPVGVITSGIPINLFNHLKIDFVSTDFNMLSEDLVQYFHNKGILVYVWALGVGDALPFVVDGVILDYNQLQ